MNSDAFHFGRGDSRASLFRSPSSALLVLALSTAWILAGNADAGQLVTQPFRGVTLIHRTEVFPRPVTMNVAIIDLQADGIRFKLTPPHGTRDTFPQTTLEYLNQENAQLAVNCHFYLPFPAAGADVNVVGFAASEGVLYSPFEPQPIAPGFLDQSYAILPRAPAMNIDPFNRVSILHPDPDSADGRAWLEPAALGNAFSGSAQIVTRGAISIPQYGVGLGMLTPRNGYSESLSWYDFVNARTAVGVSRDGRALVLMTVDNVGGSWGMTVGEVAGVLVNDYDVVDALNLDGDGSTTFVMQDPDSLQGVFVNSPGEWPAGRSVGSNLAVFALPILPPGPALFVSPAPPGCVWLSWSTPSEGWELQSSPDLQGWHWASVGGQPKALGDHREILLPTSGLSCFYRLAFVPPRH
ncbi:MAG: phosphodiester glycosidase family protein [Verrucomicrobia bacterium]|nr:phosphodiester glycosidase family protein [Verrucomicrobiota bacterium]MBI3868013.1 phosphodiester glycosidase family protein [Verrucomicrobiota bacterium]